MTSVEHGEADKDQNIKKAMEKARNYMTEDDPIKRIVLRDLKDIVWAESEIEVLEGSLTAYPAELNKARQAKEKLMERRNSNKGLPGYSARASEIEVLIQGLERAMIQDWGPEEVNNCSGAVKIFPKGPIPL